MSTDSHRNPFRRTGLGQLMGDREVRCDSCGEWSHADGWELVGDENSECPECGAMDNALMIPESREVG